MKILSLSDQIIPFIYSPQLRLRFKDIDLVIGCGDLPYYYLEYVLTVLNVPLFFVRGNHDKVIEYSPEGQRAAPHGGMDIHRRVCKHEGLLLAGVAGSLRYRPGEFQYTQSEMWNHVFCLVPGMFYNRLKCGRFLDVFVTHAPPAGIHDKPDLPHQGIRAFRWLISVFQPFISLHGHIHIYRPDGIRESILGRTQIINSYGFRETEIKLGN